MSILGSGWLGLPLAAHFLSIGHRVKASTTSESRVPELLSIDAEPFVIDIAELFDNIEDFLQADVLIINIPSKDIEAYRGLLRAIEKSEIEKVLLVSSTSVYENKNTTISESDGGESALSPLVSIETLFKKCRKIKTSIVRFGGLIGYSRNPGTFFRKGRQVQNPDSHVNLIHRDDCIGIVHRIIEQEAWGDVFNCCADTHPTKREFYTHAAHSIGGITPEFAGLGDNSFKIISNLKVKQKLHYKFLYPDVMTIKF